MIVYVVSSDQTHGEMKHQGEDPQIEDDKENKYEGTHYIL